MGPSSTGLMSPMSTTLSKATRKAGKVKLPFSQNNHISKRLRVHTPGGGDGGGQGFKVFQVGRVLYISEQHGEAMVSDTFGINHFKHYDKC